MVKQYPHTLVFATPGTEGSFNEDGFFVPGEAAGSASLPCRYEESSSRGDATVVGVDNQTYRQAGIIYLPKGSEPLPAEGTRVEVVGMFSGRITRPYVGQLNITIKAY